MYVHCSHFVFWHVLQVDCAYMPNSYFTGNAKEAALVNMGLWATQRHDELYVQSTKQRKPKPGAYFVQ